MAEQQSLLQSTDKLRWAAWYWLPQVNATAPSKVRGAFSGDIERLTE